MMLRDESLAHNLEVEDQQSVWPVLARRPAVTNRVSDACQEKLPFRAVPAVPDVPASVGKLLAGTYLGLVAALALATAGPGQSVLALVIAALFVVGFFAVPYFIFAQEPVQGRRPDMQRFLAEGLHTYTGHCSGGAALVQMFVVPVLLTLGILAIAVVIAVAG